MDAPRHVARPAVQVPAHDDPPEYRDAGHQAEQQRFRKPAGRLPYVVPSGGQVFDLHGCSFVVVNAMRSLYDATPNRRSKPNDPFPDRNLSVTVRLIPGPGCSLRPLQPARAPAPAFAAAFGMQLQGSSSGQQGDPRAPPCRAAPISNIRPPPAGACGRTKEKAPEFPPGPDRQAGATAMRPRARVT